MIKYDSTSREICLETDKGEIIVLTKEALEAVCAYFYENYGTYTNAEGRIKYEYID